jgi:hypothetical protein
MPGVEAAEYQDHPGCDADGLNGFDNLVIPERAAARTRNLAPQLLDSGFRVFDASPE